MNAIDLLLQRNSSPRLKEPAPQGAELETVFQAALRAPDHARLRPWRFLTITGEDRLALGQLFAQAAQARNPSCSEVDLDKAKAQPFRAPLIVIAVACYSDHPKVPQTEQLLSAGCAVHGMLLATHALGFGGVWRTGENAFDRNVMNGLGLQEHEAIVGYLYIGTREGVAKPLPAMNSSDFVKAWP
ncbi:MAG: nitroreductase [Pseudohongiellaceae bacterium]|jgi:nitroreductase